MPAYPAQVRRLLALLSAMILVAAACSRASTPASEQADAPSQGAASGTEPAPPASLPSDLATTDVVAFMDHVTRAILERDPEWMTDLGLADRHDRLTPVDPAYQAETAGIAEAALAELATIDVDLDADTAVSLEIFEWWLRDLVAGSGYIRHGNPVNFITGAHVNLPEFLIDVHPIGSLRDAEDYVARMDAMGDKLDELRRQVIENADDGYLMPVRSRDIARWQVQQMIDGGAEALVSELQRRMTEAGLDGQDIDRLTGDAADAVSAVVIPAYRDLESTLDRVDVRETDGVWDLPDGDAYYRWVLRQHTTSDLTPEEMHEWGLAEVERVRSELDEALTAMGYDTSELNRAIGEAIGDAGQIPLASPADRQAFLDLNAALVDEAYAAFDSMFSTLPSAEVIIQRPAPTREGGSGAYYRNPDLAGGRPGIYYLSMGGGSTTAHDYKTTTYHEAVPGHHFQLALQAELDNPLHQRAVVFSGPAEGWALYAERLAYEAGLYDDDPFGNIGRLQLELLRAARVVTDTGIHALRWTREEAIRYHMEATALPEQFSTSEVDRYIVWPGQAPGYLLGMDAILTSRADAVEALGERFDLAAFHDVVLGHGSVPLPVLEAAVEAWIARQAG